MKRKWNQEAVLTALVDAYYEGIPLRANAISKFDSGLYAAIYQDYGSGPIYGSLVEARVEVADLLRKLGDLEATEKVLSLNGPPIAPNKLSDKEVVMRKQQLVETLLDKIDNEEDVSYRFLQSTDRPFVSQCRRFFGKYKGVFEAAGVDYQKYARHIKKSKKEYLGELVEHILSGHNLDRKSMETENRFLVDRLNAYYDGYYNALEAAGRISAERGVEIDVGYWQSFGHKENKRRASQRKRYGLKQIREMERDTVYVPEDLGVDFEGQLTGKDIAEVLRNNGWQTGEELSLKLGCSPSNLRNHLPKFGRFVIRYVEGERSNLLFHNKVLSKYERKNKERDIPKDSIRKFAEDHGVGYSKVR